MTINDNSYITIGDVSNPPLLLIHGLASNKYTWKVILHFLKKHYYIVSIDLPGHGQNSESFTDFSYINIVDYIANLQIHLSINFDYIAGHSYGASIATSVSFDSRFNIKKIALLDGGMIPMKLIPEMNQDNYKTRLSPPDFTNRKFESISDFIDKNLSLKSNTYSEDIKYAILSNFDHTQKPKLVPFLNRTNHLNIVDYLWDYNPEIILSQIDIPVLGLMACKFDSIVDSNSYRCEYTDYLQSINSRISINWILNTPHDLQLYAPKLVSRKLVDHFS
jgi:pimeloyl-ACP methyl ester carboxylesterase